MKNNINQKEAMPINNRAVDRQDFKPGRLSTVLLVALVLIVSGCTAVGPNYVQEQPEVPDNWQTSLRGDLSAERPAADLSRWWTILQDSQLAALEERARQGNLVLKEAQARIREARAMRGIRQAERFPTVDGNAAVRKSRSSENSNSGEEKELFSLGFDAGWEADIFGGVQRSIEASQADLEVTQENLYHLQVTLMAEVALNYVELRTFQRRLDLNRENIKILQESYELNDSRYQAGVIAELAVQESLRLLESAKSMSPVFAAGVDAAKNRLAVLIGEYPGQLHEELATIQPLPSLPVNVVVGIPAETLRRRPDVRRAERSLAAQTARIGVATADLYPKFRLTGTLGLESLRAGDLLTAGSRTWGIGPVIEWNIFDAGSIRRNIEVQNARQEQALIQYEKSILTALEEVENALVAYAQEQQRKDAVARASVAAERAFELAQDQYLAGLVSFNNVLDAQRSLLTLRDELAGSNGNIVANLIRIYKALGGGWSYEKGFQPSHLEKGQM
ncbi:efflux transporter outer membrane subunit [uncultured Desulfuromusa sp.]|uniref:efflux transporter outer membrane subunit n=1 Tax=uncultured Desulfuromusa sp. TaxID=219183 RepID=UPI002AA88EB6|nr:efflux transporter outer membrane subunit [uncultured Desulfuromusa sp.]